MCTASPATNTGPRKYHEMIVNACRPSVCVDMRIAHWRRGGGIHRLGLCQALETKSSVGHSQAQCRCGLCSATSGPRERTQCRDTTCPRLVLSAYLVTLTLVGDMSRLRVRDSRLSAVSLSPLSLSRSRRHRLRSPDTVHSAPRIAESRHSHVTRPDFPSRGKAPAPRSRAHVVPTLDVPG
jgi:hypothetical protein